MTRWAAAAAAITVAAALVSCGHTTGGTAVCPGCGTNAEPSFGTPAPSMSSPTAAPPTPAPTPGDTGTPGPGSGDVETLPTDAQGYVYIETKSGKTRCQLNSESVGCESEFENAPEIDGAPAHGVQVTADGTMTWVQGNLGAIPTVALDYRMYSAAGWTIVANPDGTRFLNDATGHGMAVAVEGVHAF